jgi:septal ring factor EnvC (AmiA/AmiB activator)
VCCRERAQSNSRQWRRYREEANSVLKRTVAEQQQRIDEQQRAGTEQQRVVAELVRWMDEQQRTVAELARENAALRREVKERMVWRGVKENSKKDAGGRVRYEGEGCTQTETGTRAIGWQTGGRGGE